MNLPFLKKSPLPNTRKYLFALEISPQTVKSAIWSVVNDKTQVLAVGISVNWDDKSEESLIAASDQTLSDATSHLDPSGNVGVNEVIFGLPPGWVEQDKIRLNKLSLLKTMAMKLDLKPVGFVVTADAVVKYLHHSEGVPPTAICLGFWPNELEVTLVRMGKVDGTETVKRSSQLADDVVEGLSRFLNVDVMPSRMLLYNSGLDLEETKQLLLQYPWQAPQKKLPFLHFPKVETLPSDFAVRAIALAGGTEVARAIGLLSVETLETEVEPEVEPMSESSELGFIPDADIGSVSFPPSLQPETAEPVSLPPVLKPTWHLPKLKFSAAAMGGVLIVIMVAGGVGYWYLPKAQVMVFVRPQDFQTSFAMTADASLDRVDVQGKAIPAQGLTVEVSANKTAPTTGSKLVGDRATGVVAIINNVGSARSLPAGMVLTSPSGLKFVLDEVVTVASASGDATNLQPGRTTAKITAFQIGADFNLSAGTVFRVGTYSSLETAAKNDAALSGGSSRQAKVVGEKDVSQLRSLLVADLKSGAQDKLTQQIPDDQTVISESVAVETVSEDFNHKMGEEAEEVTLSLTVKATGMVVNRADLQSIVDYQIKPAIPAGYTTISRQSQSFEVKEASRDKTTLQVTVSALLLPTIDQEEVVRNIRGKSPVQAQQYLHSLPAAAQVDMVITPRLPAAVTVLPRVAKNISLSIQPVAQ